MRPRGTLITDFDHDLEADRHDPLLPSREDWEREYYRELERRLLGPAYDREQGDGVYPLADPAGPPGLRPGPWDRYDPDFERIFPSPDMDDKSTSGYHDWSRAIESDGESLPSTGSRRGPVSAVDRSIGDYLIDPRFYRGFQRWGRENVLSPLREAVLWLDCLRRGYAAKKELQVMLMVSEAGSSLGVTKDWGYGADLLQNALSTGEDVVFSSEDEIAQDIMAHKEFGKIISHMEEQLWKKQHAGRTPRVFRTVVSGKDVQVEFKGGKLEAAIHGAKAEYTAMLNVFGKDVATLGPLKGLQYTGRLFVTVTDKYDFDQIPFEWRNKFLWMLNDLALTAQKAGYLKNFEITVYIQKDVSGFVPTVNYDLLQAVGGDISDVGDFLDSRTKDFPPRRNPWRDASK